jgi:hypothetical protein
MQQFLKPAAGAAGAQVVAPELLDQLLAAADYARTALDAGLGRVALAPLTRDLETGTARDASSWHSPREFHFNP